MDNYKLYFLYDPDKSNIPRYAGITLQRKCDRLWGHINSRPNNNKKKYEWIQALLKNGQKPRIHIIADNLSLERAKLLERKIIFVCKHLYKEKFLNIHPGGNGHFSKKKIKTKNVNRWSSKTRKIIQYDLCGNKLFEFSSVVEASKITKTSQRSIIDCCKGRKNIKKFFTFRYDNDDFNIFAINKICNQSFPKEMLQLDNNFKIIGHFLSATEAEKNTGISLRHLSRGDKVIGGFRWLIVKRGMSQENINKEIEQLCHLTERAG